MKFTKMQGCGNDYVYVNCLEETISDPEQLAREVSDRHYGMGSDGLILICPSKVADFEMVMYNADGSRSEMCGNGIRCVGKYVYDYGLTDKTSVSIETLAGIKYLDLTVENGVVRQVRVNMGAPIFEPELVPCKIAGEWTDLPTETEGQTQVVIAKPLIVDGKEYAVTCISMGNPHCVIFMEEDVRTLDLEKIGPAFENHEVFPKRVNTEFVNVIDETHLRMRVWERGSGETLACGTGTCATAVAAMLNGHTQYAVDVELLGGNLLIEWDRETNQVYMTGPAEVVYDGVYRKNVQ
ncbi:MAG: diaminopimelate epimerase [Eubacterium sp.]|nr:diaminopimelate epimerase [Eubacterium sp.]